MTWQHTAAEPRPAIAPANDQRRYLRAAPQEPTAYYQRYRIRRDTTNERADLKDEQPRQEDQFDTEELVQFPIQELKGAGRQKVHGPVPSDIVQVLELVCNVRDRGGDDGVVQSDTKDRKAEARERDD